MLSQLDKEQVEVDQVTKVVEEQSEEVKKEKLEAEEIQEECKMRLDEASPLLEEAINALKTLKPNDFVTMKSYTSPPILIKLALEAACVMLGYPPKIVEVGEGKNMVKTNDYWPKAKQLLNEYKKFLEKLVKYEKDNIPQDRLNKIQEYLNNPKFKPEII